jgi:hypothetical protein
MRRAGYAAPHGLQSLKARAGEAKLCTNGLLLNF